MTEVKMPKVGLSEADMTLISWLKQPGDAIAKGESIAVVEGEKLTNEIESVVDGTMGEIFVQEGDVVAIGTLLATITD